MTSPIRDAARAANSAGLVPIPIRGDATKAPALISWREYQTRRPSNSELRKWFTADTPGLGIICGAISGGLELLEFEACADMVTFQDLITSVGLEPLWLRIMSGYWGSSPSGGHHFPYRISDMTVPGNTKLARYQDGAGIHVVAETRGEGGYFVAAPSLGVCHPSGQPWTMILGGFDTIATISADERSELHRVVRLLDAMPEAPVIPHVTVNNPQSLTDGDRPGDLYNARGLGGFRSLLTTNGWEFVSDRGGIDYYRRPGKQIGISATVAIPGTAGRTGQHPTLKVFSSSTPFDTERTYDLLGALAILEHGGDISAAARALSTHESVLPRPTPPPQGHQTGHDRPEQEEQPLNDGPINWPEFWSHDHPDEEWVIEPLVPRGRGVSLYAPAKEGKSTILLAACAAAATGQPIFGQAAQPARRCMYADYEMTRADLQQRLTELGYGPHTDLTNLIYWVIPPWAPLDTVEGGVMITAAALQYAAEVVFIDTIGRAVAGGENDSDTLRSFYRCTGQALKREGVAWLRADHSGKNLTKGARGTSAKNDDVDIQWFLKRGQNGITITRTHTRISWVPEKIVLQKREDDNGVVTYEITNERGYGEGTKELAELLDSLNIPITFGRGKARAALIEAGETASIRTLEDAIRWRKLHAVQFFDPFIEKK